MTIEDMNYNIAARQIKRQNYQQRYFEKPRQLDTIDAQVQQLREAIAQAEEDHNVGLAQRLRDKLLALIERWQKVKDKVR